MKKWIRSNILYLIGAAFGALAGYPDSYRDWQQVSCASGTCIITPKPINITLYGALTGVLLFGIFKKENKAGVIKKTEENHDV